jgi:hypothetical protein
LFKEQRAKTKLEKRSSSSAGKLPENSETPKPYFVRKPSLRELSFIEMAKSEPYVREMSPQSPENILQQTPQQSPRQSPQFQYFKDPFNPNKRFSIDQLEKPNIITQPTENLKQPSNLEKNVEKTEFSTQPIGEESTVTVKSSSLLKFFGKETSSASNKVTARSELPKLDNTIQPIQEINDSAQTINANAPVTNNTTQSKELSDTKSNNSKSETNLDKSKLNQPTISTSAKINESINPTQQKTNTPAKPAPLTPGFQRILTNNFVPLNPIQPIDREFLVTPKRYYKQKEVDEKRANKDLLLDEPKRAKGKEKEL